MAARLRRAPGTNNQNNDRPAPQGPAAPTEAARQAPAPVPADNLCTDQSLSVVLYTDKATYKVGDQPVFTIAVTNGGLTECVRDIGKSAQNVVVRSLDGTRTLWSARTAPAADGEERDFRTRSAGSATRSPGRAPPARRAARPRASQFRQVPTARSARSASGNPHRSPSTSSHQRSSRNRDQQPVAVARRFSASADQKSARTGRGSSPRAERGYRECGAPRCCRCPRRPADRQRWSPAAPAAIRSVRRAARCERTAAADRANSR